MEYRKIYIENFGKIRSAEIELAPMLLFVGDNNSGKKLSDIIDMGTSELWKNRIFFTQKYEKKHFL